MSPDKFNRAVFDMKAKLRTASSLLIAVFATISCSTAPNVVQNVLAETLQCTAIAKVPDYNCDSQVVVSVLGDSFVYGIGDKAAPPAGYVARTARKLPGVTFHNLGTPGLKAKVLYRRILRVFKRANAEFLTTGVITEETVNQLAESDYVVLDVGRNDRWYFAEPSVTQRYLQLIEEAIRDGVAKINGTEPLVIKAVMMLPNRGSQGPWVAALDDLILESSTEVSPADLRFDLVSKRLLQPDQLHPSPQGYAALAATFTKYLQNAVPKKVAALRRATL